jgi:hypothetical protein
MQRNGGPGSKPAIFARFPAWAWVAGGVGLIAVVGVLAYLLSTGGGTSLPLKPASALGSLKTAPAAGEIGPEGVPIPKAPALAAAGWLTLGESRDGITCEPIEQLAYHIHVHLTIFVDGKARSIPYGIGIAPPRMGTSTPSGYFVTNGSCFAWLHTHASDGIIHIESPSAKTYTLGDFFDIWGQPLGLNQVGPIHGHVTALFNGKYYTGNPRNLPLLKHAQIQLEIGKPLIAPEKITFPDGL